MRIISTPCEECLKKGQRNKILIPEEDQRGSDIDLISEEWLQLWGTNKLLEVTA